MDYEKRYKEALEVAKAYYYVDDNNEIPVCSRGMAEHIFPELKELEGEKIRKRLLALIEWSKSYASSGITTDEAKEMLAWLEKQGEKKSSDEVLKIRQAVYQSGYNDGYKHGIEDVEKGEKKHKFIIGDIISNNNTIYRVDNIVKNCIGQDCYFLVNVKREKDGTRYLKLFDSDGKTHNSGEITWLCEQVDAKFEKQGEQKPTDKVEPKFKVGDWIVDKSGLAQEVLDFRGGIYTCTYNSFTTDCESNYHLWTIQDAKDGDVLSAHECIVLFKEIDGLNIKCHCTYHFMNNPSFYVNTLQNKSAFHPATKEQRALLFQNIKEAGYKWNAEKKDLKNIEQNPVWSEDDDKMFNSALWHIKNSCSNGGKNSGEFEVYNWLKSLKERIKGE